MKKRIYLGIVVTAILAIVNTHAIKAIEPVSMVVGALAVAGISKAIDGVMYLLGPSKSDNEYTRRHEERSQMSKAEFIAGIQTERQLSKTPDPDKKILTNHELYRYQAFIDAIKETCPDYASYIKALMAELDANPKTRIVRGFETDHLYHKGKGVFMKRAKDFSEFYKLIQKLYAEVLMQEKQKSTGTGSE